MIRIRATRSPFQFMFMVASTLGGLALLVLRQRIGSTLAQQLPPAITVVLGVGLLVTGLTTLLGMAMKRVLGLLLERAGLAAMAMLMISYTGFTIAFIGLKGLIALDYFLAIVGGSVWRIRQISGDLHEAESAIQDGVRDRSRGESR